MLKTRVIFLTPPTTSIRASGISSGSVPVVMVLMEVDDYEYDAERSPAYDPLSVGNTMSC
jgi:hypothetical protein